MTKSSPHRARRREEPPPPLPPDPDDWKEAEGDIELPDKRGWLPTLPPLPAPSAGTTRMVGAGGDGPRPRARWYFDGGGSAHVGTLLAARYVLVALTDGHWVLAGNNRYLLIPRVARLSYGQRQALLEGSGLKPDEYLRAWKQKVAIPRRDAGPAPADVIGLSQRVSGLLVIKADAA